jgi:hypothetical protein
LESTTLQGFCRCIASNAIDGHRAILFAGHLLPLFSNSPDMGESMAVCADLANSALSLCCLLCMSCVDRGQICFRQCQRRSELGTGMENNDIVSLECRRSTHCSMQSDRSPKTACTGTRDVMAHSMPRCEVIVRKPMCVHFHCYAFDPYACRPASLPFEGGIIKSVLYRSMPRRKVMPKCKFDPRHHA